MAKLPIEFILPLMEKIGLVNNGKPISKTAFAKLADCHKYTGGYIGKAGIYIIYFGPMDNCFGFYPSKGNKRESLEEAYAYYLDCFTDTKEEFLDGNVCWGNCGIPISYNDLRVDEVTMLKLILTKPFSTELQPWTFFLGSARVETLYLNELRDIVEELKTKIANGFEYSNKITDFIFSVETSYQQHYELDENNFDIVHD